MGINKFNAEGYYDPTAYEALTAVTKEEKATKVFRPLIYICSPYSGDIETNCFSQTILLVCNGKGIYPNSPTPALSAISG